MKDNIRMQIATEIDRVNEEYENEDPKSYKKRRCLLDQSTVLLTALIALNSIQDKINEI